MERGAVSVIYACWLLTKTHGFLPGASFPGRSLAPGRSQANHAASNESHMHDVDMLYAGPRANGRDAPANLSPRGQAVVTSLAWRFLILPICRAERLPRHGSRHGFGLDLRRGDRVSPRAVGRKVRFRCRTETWEVEPQRLGDLIWKSVNMSSQIPRRILGF